VSREFEDWMEKRYGSMMVSPEKMCKDYRADHPHTSEELAAQIPEFEKMLVAAQGFADALVPFIRYAKEAANGPGT
jgi:hypothetical protein